MEYLYTYSTSKVFPHPIMFCKVVLGDIGDSGTPNRHPRLPKTYPTPSMPAVCRGRPCKRCLCD